MTDRKTGQTDYDKAYDARFEVGWARSPIDRMFDSEADIENEENRIDRALGLAIAWSSPTPGGWPGSDSLVGGDWHDAADRLQRRRNGRTQSSDRSDG